LAHGRENVGGMALEAVQVDARRYRWPWYWLAVLLLVALGATAAIEANARSRIAQNDGQFEAAQQLRLQRIEQRIDDYFGDAAQMAAAAAELVAPARGDRALTKRLIRGLYRARRNAGIYGIGAFFEPYAFDPRVRVVSVYDRAAGPPPRGESAAMGAFDQRLPGDIDEIAYDSSRDTNPPSERPSDYTKKGWYADAFASPEAVTFAGPYWDSGRSFISALKAIRGERRPIGVVSVDTLTAQFKGLMTQSLARGDVAYVSGTSGIWLLGTSSLPRDRSNLIDRSERLRNTNHAVVHVAADASGLRASDRNVTLAAAGETAAVWGFAALFGVGLTRIWRSREATLELELEQARLENEIAVGKKVELELRKAAYTDALTGLPNRAAFLQAASAAIADAGDPPRHAVFFIDLDRFNMINETLGHLAGDDLLKMIAARLHDALPIHASVARLGGDEFVVCAPVDPQAAGEFADRILACLKDPILLAGRACYTAASIGIVIVDSSYRTPEELLRDADIAMYAAKERGRARYAVFDTSMRGKVKAESDLENDLRRAIEQHEFVPYYQPIVDIVTGRVTSFEALARWNRANAGVVAAAEFIGFAEARGLIDEIDMSILQDVCADSHALLEHFPQTTVAVNVSAGHLTAPGLAERIGAAMRANRLSADRLKIEVTETAIMSNAEQSRATLERLRLDGVQIVLDDFGAGHSSLNYLHRLPIAGLKIDRSFVERLASDDQAVAIVRSIVALAATLGLYTIAEGVESQAQLAILKELDVGYAQGFFFSPALGLAQLLRYSAEETAI
jgi:diguanylate cyclase (GGDEF)-like protein